MRGVFFWPTMCYKLKAAIKCMYGTYSKLADCFSKKLSMLISFLLYAKLDIASRDTGCAKK